MLQWLGSIFEYTTPANKEIIALDGISDGIYYIVATGLQNNYTCKSPFQNHYCPE